MNIIIIILVFCLIINSFSIMLLTTQISFSNCDNEYNIIHRVKEVKKNIYR